MGVADHLGLTGLVLDPAGLAAAPRRPPTSCAHLRAWPPQPHHCLCCSSQHPPGHLMLIVGGTKEEMAVLAHFSAVPSPPDQPLHAGCLGGPMLGLHLPWRMDRPQGGVSGRRDPFQRLGPPAAFLRMSSVVRGVTRWTVPVLWGPDQLLVLYPPVPRRHLLASVVDEVSRNVTSARQAWAVRACLTPSSLPAGVHLHRPPAVHEAVRGASARDQLAEGRCGR